MRNFALAILLVLTFGRCLAQSVSDKPVEPTAIGDVFLLDTSNQTLKPLPAEEWKEKAHSKRFTIISSIEVDGDQSPFRMKAGAPTEFIFKIGNPESVTIYPFVQKKKKRLADYSKLYGEQGTPIPGLPVETTQYGASSYKLVPKAPLGPGEYMIYAGTNPHYS